MTGWDVLVAGDAGPLANFLSRSEYRCVAVSDHMRPFVAELHQSGQLANPAKYGLWVHRGEPEGPDAAAVSLRDRVIDGAAVMCPNGAAYCILPDAGRDDEALAELFASAHTLSHLCGECADIRRLQPFLRKEVAEIKDYLLMAAGYTQTSQPSPQRGRAPVERFIFKEERKAEPAALRAQGIEVRHATMRDLPALSALHGAYEAEEMLINSFVLFSGLHERTVSLLKRQIVVVALKDGKAVGKANTNARGVLADQIGGVYVRPESREAGIGTLMVGFLVGCIRGKGRNAVLYVRPDNIAAIKIYRNLGFREVGGYRALYC